MIKHEKNVVDNCTILKTQNAFINYNALNFGDTIEIKVFDENQYGNEASILLTALVINKDSRKAFKITQILGGASLGLETMSASTHFVYRVGDSFISLPIDANQNGLKEFSSRIDIVKIGVHVLDTGLEISFLESKNIITNEDVLKVLLVRVVVLRNK